jgi:lycopene cyclase CruA
VTMAYADDLAAVKDALGPELAERLAHLDGVRTLPRAAPRLIAPPERGSVTDYDVLLAGGGLSLLYAPLLAASGLRVAVLERTRAGASHREWNASYPELLALVRVGLLSEAELGALIVARYREGVCAFHGGGSYPVRGVLDHAVDAGALLTLARHKAEALGAHLLDGHEVLALGEGPDAVRVLARDAGGRERELSAALVLDARGAASPYATADLVCPTVGGVVRGLEMDTQVGDILVTIDDADAGRQHVWEGFPGHPGETTVYVFYYARRGHEGTLAALYGRFFRDLGKYKRGAATMVRPTFGFIPGWSRLTPAPAPPGPRIVLVGDAAARHSPLTYCGFGATLRSLGPVSAAVLRAFEEGPSRALAGSVVDDAKVHRWTGALAALIASERSQGAALNALLDAAFSTLAELGEERYAALLRDEMHAEDFVTFLRRTSLKRPEVYADVWKGLGGASLPWAWKLFGDFVRGAPRAQP